MIGLVKNTMLSSASLQMSHTECLNKYIINVNKVNIFLWFKYVTYFERCVLKIYSISAKLVVQFFNHSNYTVFIAP